MTLASAITSADSEGGETARATVTCTVCNARAIGGKAVFALVDVELLIEGVAVVIRGVQARRIRDGGTSIHLPTFKAADGSWLPAVELPAELRGPLADAVLQFLVEERLAQPRYRAETPRR
jgi:hypothetical protein